jgi:hypothetical protein
LLLVLVLLMSKLLPVIGPLKLADQPQAGGLGSAAAMC